MPPRRVAAKRAQERLQEQGESAPTGDATPAETDTKTYPSREPGLYDEEEEEEGDELASTKPKLYCTTKRTCRCSS